jgi:hypothetical protein
MLSLVGCASHDPVVFQSDYQPTLKEEDYFFYFPGTDFTKGQSDVCTIHGVKMTREVVPVVYGTRLPAKELDRQAEFAAAHFPNAMTECWLGCVNSGYKKARVFRCPECPQWEKEWKAGLRRS